MSEDTKLVVVYKGFDITYNEDNDRWNVEVDDGKWFTRQGLAKAKTAVDEFLKRDLKTARFTAWSAKWGNVCNRVPVTVTSFTEDGKSAWVVAQDGAREKVSLTQLFQDCAENLKLFAEYDELEKKQNELTNKKRSVGEQFLRVEFVRGKKGETDGQ
jgi:hypothetical protein